MSFSRLTIRTRITGGSLLIAILISAVAGILIFGQVRRIVTDGQLAVLSNIEAPYLTALRTDTSEAADAPSPTQLIAVIKPDQSRPVDSLPGALSHEIDDVRDDAGTTRTVVAGGVSYLVRVTKVTVGVGDWYVVSAVNDDAQVSVLNQVAALLIGSIVVINLAFGAASWLIGSAALRPVARLRRSAAELVRRPDGELLPVGPAEDEVADLARTLNDLIAALRSSAERERQIVSDASHELRTPLAIISTQLELAQAEALSLDQMRADVAAAQHTLARLTTLAASLLELSRIDAEAEPGRSTLHDLGVELADAADRGRARVGGRDIRIDYATPPDAVGNHSVAVATPDFGRVCDNLVGNALAAMGRSGGIDLLLDVEGDCAVLRVADDAGGMSESFVPHALERFSSGDSARTGTGAGLGLAIVAGIAALAGGDVAIENHPGHGLTVSVLFPLISP